MTVLRDIALGLEIGLLVIFALVVAGTLIAQRPTARTYHRTRHARHA